MWPTLLRATASIHSNLSQMHATTLQHGRWMDASGMLTVSVSNISTIGHATGHRKAKSRLPQSLGGILW